MQLFGFNLMQLFGFNLLLNLTDLTNCCGTDVILVFVIVYKFFIFFSNFSEHATFISLFSLLLLYFSRYFTVVFVFFKFEDITKSK